MLCWVADVCLVTLHSRLVLKKYSAKNFQDRELKAKGWDCRGSPALASSQMGLTKGIFGPCLCISQTAFFFFFAFLINYTLTIMLGDDRSSSAYNRCTQVITSSV